MSGNWDNGTLRLALQVRERHGVQPGLRGPVCALCEVEWPCWPFHLAQNTIRALFSEEAPHRVDAPTGYLWAVAGGRPRASAPEPVPVPVPGPAGWWSPGPVHPGHPHQLPGGQRHD